jgi:O-antigen/teichoic acid export membrane protein
LVLLLALVFASLNGSQVLVIHFASVTFTCAAGFYLLNKQFALRQALRPSRRPTREMVRFSLPLHVDYLIATFRSNIQTVLLGALNTIATVGVFTVASQVNLIGQMFHQSIVTASMPIVSDLYSRGEREQMARFYQTMTKWTFTLNLPLFLAALLFPGPILSLFGRDFVDGALALTILAWGNLINTGTGICGVVINMTGNTIYNVLNSVILLVTTLGLNIILIPRWGVVGAATATMVAAVGVNLLRLVEVYALFRLLPYNASFLKPVAAGLFTFAVVGGARQLFHTNAQLATAIASVILIFGLYTGVVLLLGLSEEDRLVLTRLTQRVGAALAR